MTLRWTFLTMVTALVAAPGANAENRTGARNIPSLTPPDTITFLRRETRRMPVERPLLEAREASPLREGIVGRLPVAPNLDLRVGLLKVLRGKSGERAVSRIHSISDLGGRHERVAAAGLNFNF